ncbi:MAG: phosphoribosylaminoimidazolesuccinocarboxamide synthase [Deltaproteobacteria bacterium HGW-Deltaproteobacteria-17]|nr:MAG: phosphoribosylaminoimidazolesuccinocarboxamide synthase [Deltaproteobacteria bacterium HGW-Deltaproteobacteria-17]
MISQADLERSLDLAVHSVDFGGRLTKHHSGKVRDIFIVDDHRLLFVTSDRLSVFDRVIGSVPFKGQVLSGISNWWMERITDIVPHHLLAAPHPSCVIAKRCRPLPIEVIVRGYLTGASPTSIWTAYENGHRRYCGHDLPDGMTRHQALPEPLLTPTTKGDVGAHDELISREEIIGQGLVPADLYDRIQTVAIALYRRGAEQAARSGLLLADTKYEFGLDEDGTLTLIDEIHTPDSSRYWFAEDYRARVDAGLEPRGLDKDYVRNYMKSQGFVGNGEAPPLPAEIRMEAARRYVSLYELLTGATFHPDFSSLETTVLDHLN